MSNFKEKIKKLLTGEDEEVIWEDDFNTYTIFFVTKGGEGCKKGWYRIRGYDAKRNEVYPRYATCIGQDSVNSILARIHRQYFG